MAEGNGNDRISVSRETLRAELVTLKLDLMERLATRASVDTLGSQVLHLDQRLVLLEQNALKKDGPVAGSIREMERHIERIDARRETGEKERAEQEAAETRGFTKKEKLFSAAVGLVLLALQVHPFHL